MPTEHSAAVDVHAGDYVWDGWAKVVDTRRRLADGRIRLSLRVNSTSPIGDGPHDRVIEVEPESTIAVAARWPYAPEAARWPFTPEERTA